MPRLTRAESQSRNREQLLRTARELFLRDGYQATSLAAIAEAAGFSTGAVYSNFASKAEMALPVLRAIQAEQLAALAAVLDAGLPREDMLTALRDWADRASTSGWPRLELEFALDARTDHALVAAEADRQRSAVQLVAATIRRQLPEPLAELLPVRELAEAAINLAIGLAVRRLIDPNVSVDSLIDLLRNLLRTFEH